MPVITGKPLITQIYVPKSPKLRGIVYSILETRMNQLGKYPFLLTWESEVLFRLKSSEGVTILCSETTDAPLPNRLIIK